MRISLQELLAAGGPVIADGAMGSRLFAAGLPSGAAPELWNVQNPEAVKDIHRSYVEAGSQIILTNTFGGSRLMLDMHHLGERAAELNQAAAENASSIAAAAHHPVVVAGSIGPTGKMFAPFGPLDEQKAAAIFAEQAAALSEGGVDVFWIETMSDLKEIAAAVAGCRQANPALPVVTTMSFDRKGHTMMGVSPQQALETFEALDVFALGANCGNGPDEILGVIEKMHALDAEAILVAKANAGMPKFVDGKSIYDASPEVMGQYAREARAAGATIIGACCGSNASHIAAICRELAAGG
ncbi:MAG: betaine--homocysteine S-methyltransferase [Candidatus Promineifilaceae bacterium]|jgi:5-methyltetrahydrofolate--homocysteine methyltransferase